MLCVGLFPGIVCVLLGCCADHDAVNLYTAPQFNDKAFPAVDIAGLDQVSTLGIDLDDYIRCLYFQSAGVDYIIYKKGVLQNELQHAPKPMSS